MTASVGSFSVPAETALCRARCLSALESSKTVAIRPVTIGGGSRTGVVSRMHFPECFTQAAVWEETKAHYVRLGLCQKCAGQAAYGHQIAFAQVEPPCRTCLTIVDSFDLHASKDWRKASKSLRRARLPRQAHHWGSDVRPSGCADVAEASCLAYVMPNADATRLGLGTREVRT